MRMPRPVIEENSAGDDGMNVRVPLEGGTEGLDDGDHARPGIGWFDRHGHHHPDDVVGEPGEPPHSRW
jgi:hypothetical protein